MRSSRTIIVILILLPAVAWWGFRQRALDQTRASIEELRREVEQVAVQIAEAEKTFTSLRQDLRDHLVEQQQMERAVVAADQQARQVDPDSEWNAPPAGASAWHPESPYVWVEKTLLPKLPLSGFSRNGAIDPTVTGILAIDAATLRPLSAQLEAIVDEYHRLVVARAESTEDHLPEISGIEGEKVTVVVRLPVEENAGLKHRFETVLRRHLGDARAGLLLRLAWRPAFFDGTMPHSWSETPDRLVDSGAFVTPAAASGQVTAGNPEPLVISVVRHPDGGFNVSRRSPGQSMSIGGHIALHEHIPAHLLPLFARLLDAPLPSGDSVSPVE